MTLGFTILDLLSHDCGITGVAVGSIIDLILHGKMHSTYLECKRKSQDVRVLRKILSLSISECFLECSPSLEAHSSCDSRLSGSYDVDSRSVHLCDMAAAHHGEAMERMESITEAILSDVLLICSEVLAIPVHVWKNIVVVMLEHVVQLPEVWPSLIMEVAVTN